MRRSSLLALPLAWLLLLPAVASATALSVSAHALAVPEGQGIGQTSVATFQDAGSGKLSCYSPATYFAGVSWGDGSPGTPATVALDSGPDLAGFCHYTVTAPHTFAEEGAFPVTTTVTNQTTTATAGDSASASIADAALGGKPATLSVQRLSGASTTVLTFTDADPAGAPGDYSATIQWGDGATTDGTIVANGSGGFNVTAAHPYQHVGSYSATVTVADSGGASLVVHDPVSVDGGPSPFPISTSTPVTGAPVVFTAAAFLTTHGPIRDIQWDLNGDGIFERNVHHALRVQVDFGSAGPVGIAERVRYADGTIQILQHELGVSGLPVAGCAGYCHVTFPPLPANQQPTDDGHGHACVATLSFGAIVALAQLGCFVPAADGGYDFFAESDSMSQVRINGLDLLPRGAPIHIDPVAGTISTLGHAIEVDASEIPIDLSATIQWTGLLNTTEDPNTPGLQDFTLPELNSAPGGSFEDLPFVGRFQPTLRSDGTAAVGAWVALPQIFGDFSAAITLRVDNADGIALDSLHVHLTNSRPHSLPVFKQVDIDYDAPSACWGGGLRVGDPIPIEIAATLQVCHGRLVQLGAEVGGLHAMIYANVFFDAIRFHLNTGAPDGTGAGLGGGITLTFGPTVHAGGQDLNIAELDADFGLNMGPPADYNLHGELRLLSFKVAQLVADLRMDGVFTLALDLRVPWWDDGQAPPAIRIAGSLHGWVDGPANQFGFSGSAQACIGYCIGVDAAASNIGIAGCAQLGPFQAGVGYTWADRIVHFPIGCDLSAYTGGHRPAGRMMRRGELVAPITQLYVPPRAGLVGIRIAGQSGAPSVVLHGPGGVVIAPPAAGAKRTTWWAMANGADHTLGIALLRPRAGIWRISARAGSAAIVSVQSSFALPAVHVSGRVTGVGRRRVLRYKVARLPGQLVVFIERGRKTAHIIGRTSGGVGVLRFTPSPGLAGRRTIVAVVLERRLVRRRIVVAAYRAPGALLPRRTAWIAVGRRARSLRVSWAAAQGARRYEVTVTTALGRKVLFVVGPTVHAVTMPAVLPRDPATVSIVTDGRAGYRSGARLVEVRPFHGLPRPGS